MIPAILFYWYLKVLEILISPVTPVISDIWFYCYLKFLGVPRSPVAKVIPAI